MNWRIHHRPITESTNLDARTGVPGDVFTADEQTAGRGRLDHKWLSAPGENLMCSIVLDVAGLDPAAVSTLPLVVGLAVLQSLSSLSPFAFHPSPFTLKWPNDVLIDGRKVAGILCERHGDCVIAGVGINVNQRVFAPEIADRATSLALARKDAGARIEIACVLRGLRGGLERFYDVWRSEGFAALWPCFAAVDHLKGRMVRVYAVDGDAEPIAGLCGGIRSDGTLDVGGISVFAGEAHVASD